MFAFASAGLRDACDTSWVTLVWLRSACGLMPAAPAALNITSSERTYAVALVGLVSIDAGNRLLAVRRQRRAEEDGRLRLVAVATADGVEDDQEDGDDDAGNDHVPPAHDAARILGDANLVALFCLRHGREVYR